MPSSSSSSPSSYSQISRIGGPYRQIINNSTAPSGILELAIYPPLVKQEATLNHEVLTSGYNKLGQNVSNVFHLLHQPCISLDDSISDHSSGMDDISTGSSGSTGSSTDDSPPDIHSILPSSIQLSSEDKYSLFDSVSALRLRQQSLTHTHTDNTIANHDDTDTIITDTTNTSTSTSTDTSSKRWTYNNLFFIDYGPLGDTTTRRRKPLTNLRDIPQTLVSTIGGLDNQLQDITRRLLYSRSLPRRVSNALGLTHVSGLLLYGSPGTFIDSLVDLFAALYDCTSI